MELTTKLVVVDLNHRSYKRQIYSLLHLTTLETTIIFFFIKPPFENIGEDKLNCSASPPQLKGGINMELVVVDLHHRSLTKGTMFTTLPILLSA